MSTYAFRDKAGDITSLAPDFARPRAAHTLTDAAAEAVEAVRRHGHARRAELVVSSLITNVGNPRVTPYDGPIPAAAKRIGALAERHGFTVTLHVTRGGHSLVGVDKARGRGFALHWRAGKTAGGTWHEKRERYVIAPDPRPIVMHKTDHVGLKGKRSTGMSDTRLVLVASPRGIPYNVTEIEKRIAS